MNTVNHLVGNEPHTFPKSDKTELKAEWVLDLHVRLPKTQLNNVCFFNTGCVNRLLFAVCSPLYKVEIFVGVIAKKKKAKLNSPLNSVWAYCTRTTTALHPCKSLMTLFSKDHWFTTICEQKFSLTVHCFAKFQKPMKEPIQLIQYNLDVPKNRFFTRKFNGSVLSERYLSTIIIII